MCMRATTFSEQIAQPDRNPTGVSRTELDRTILIERVVPRGRIR